MPSTWRGWGERGEATYFNNPVDYVGHLAGGVADNVVAPWAEARLMIRLDTPLDDVVPV